MKKTFFFLLLSFLLSAQKTETIDLSKSIKDSKNSIKTFTVIDQRPNQEIGKVFSNADGVSELRFQIFKNTTALDPQGWLKNL